MPAMPDRCAPARPAAPGPAWARRAPRRKASLPDAWRREGLRGSGGQSERAPAWALLRPIQSRSGRAARPHPRRKAPDGGVPGRVGRMRRWLSSRAPSSHCTLPTSPGQGDARPMRARCRRRPPTSARYEGRNRGGWLDRWRAGCIGHTTLGVPPVVVAACVARARNNRDFTGSWSEGNRRMGGLFRIIFYYIS